MLTKTLIIISINAEKHLLKITSSYDKKYFMNESGNRQVWHCKDTGIFFEFLNKKNVLVQETGKFKGRWSH